MKNIIITAMLMASFGASAHVSESDFKGLPVSDNTISKMNETLDYYALNICSEIKDKDRAGLCVEITKMELISVYIRASIDVR